MGFRNFRIWRGKLPHWRADDVTYYVTFRHRRPLETWESGVMLDALVHLHGRKCDLLIVCVLPERTELLLQVGEGRDGEPYELSEVVEKAKQRAGKTICKVRKDPWSPFYTESYDRIVRDSNEFEERWLAILDSPVNAELVEDPDLYPALWVPNST